MKEIRIHGRGGMGSVKAAEALVYAAIMDGKYGNSIPFFGFERQGAPVTAFIRISEDPIRPKNRVYNPDIVMVLDPTIMNAVDVFEGIRAGSMLILNTKQTPEELKLPENVTEVALLDATAIALETIGRNITNTVMLGAFCKATGMVSVDAVAEKVEELWGAKNKEALYKGYEAVKVTKVGEAKEATDSCGPKKEWKMEFKSKYIVPIGADGIHVLATGDWRTQRPVMDQEKCIKCGICFLHCPVNSISKKDGKFEISYDYCKGCGICAHECPKDAIDMIPEEGK